MSTGAAPVRLAIHDPAEQAWGARMLQTWLERYRRLLADNGLPPALLSECNHAATVSNRAPNINSTEPEPDSKAAQ